MKKKIFVQNIKLNNSFLKYLIIDTKSNITYLGLVFHKKNFLLKLSNQILIFLSFYYIYFFSKKKNILNLYNILIKNIIFNFCFKYKLQIEFNGIGYKILYKEQFLYFILGYSHLIKIKLPKTCDINIYNNKLLSIKHLNKYILGNIFYIIKSFKVLDVYKGKGIKNIYDNLKLKLGKTKNIK